MRGLVGMKSRLRILKRSLLGSEQKYAGDSPGTLMRFRVGNESVIVICRHVDDPAPETRLDSRSEAMQRSLVVCIEEVGDFGRY